MPDGMGRDLTMKVCGTTCHGSDIVGATGRTREQWTGVVNSMVARGAKATDTELVQIIQYLSANFGPNMAPASAAAKPGAPAGVPARGALGRGPGVLGGGAADSHVVDKAGADRGRQVYIAECITCHGPKARGGGEGLPRAQQGANLIRSLVVLHDRYGDEIGPFLLNGHPLQSGRAASTLTKEQIGDLAHFLHQAVYFTLRGGPDLRIQNVLTGDPKAGQEYFNGAGRCHTCHSPNGDLKGIGAKYDPPTLQTKFLFPRTVGVTRNGARSTPAKPVTVAVTLANGQVVEGVLDKLDDFNVSLRDAQGDYRSFRIAPEVKVVKNDPYAAHVELLDQYTDKNMHDIVAYLETLK
ncbi:MAG TPA: c-type cytochrome [Bryobacteraceae bacterium]|nr:c-type cytochrome [Bryobacteraceae bacterium]